MARFEQSLLLIVKGGFYLLPFIPLIVAPFFLFPYITGKNFAFRVIVELMAAAWVALIVFNPRRFSPFVSLSKQNAFIIVYILFVGWLFMSMLTGVDISRSFWSNFERMEGLITHLHLLALLLMAGVIFKTPRDWQPVIILSLLASILLTFYGFLERFGVVVTGTGGERLFATLGNSIYLAEYLMIHLFVIGLLFFAPALRSWRIPLLLVGLLELYIFFAASTRGALLGLIAGLGVAVVLYCFLTPHRRVRHFLLSFIIAGLGIGAVTFALRNNQAAQQFPLTAPIISLYNAFSNPAQSTQGARLMIWGIAFDALKERPLLGWGTENFIIPYARHYNPSMFGNEPWFDRAHNMFFEWFVAGGIIGGLLYLVLFASLFALLRHGWRQKILSAEEVALFCGLIVAYMIQNAFVFDTIVSYLLFFGLGAYLTMRFSSSVIASERSERGNPAENNGIASSVTLPRNDMYDPRRFAAAIILPLFLLIPLVKANINPMMSSASLITALKSVGEGKSAEEVVAAFERAFAKGTFGVTEARERLADILITIATVQGVTPESAPAYMQILNLGIRELEKEVQEHPANVRPLLFLGKLYHLRAAITGVGSEQAIEAYDRLLAQAPNYVQGYLGKAEVHLVRGEHKEAFAAGDEGLRRVGTRAPASVVMGESAALAHVLADDFDGALAILKEPRVQERDGSLRILDIDRIENVAERAMRSEKAAERGVFLKALREFVPQSKKIEELLRITEGEVGT